MGFLKLRKRKKHSELQKCDNSFCDYEEYREKLILHCKLHFEDLSRDEISDCVQNTYLAFYENLEKGIKIQNPYAWLSKVSINICLKYFKDKSKFTQVDFVDNESKDAFFENHLTYCPDYTDEIISDNEIEEKAVKIISKLNEQDRKLFYERYINKKTFVQIAEEYESNPSTIRKRHNKMREKIELMVHNTEF